MIMKSFKSMAPILVILATAVYGYLQYLQTLTSILDAWVYLPVMLALLVAILTVHFNRSAIFFYMLLIMLVGGVLLFDLAPTVLQHGLLAGLAPLLLLLLTVMPER